MAPESFVGDVDGDGMDDLANHASNDCPCGAVVFGSPGRDFTRGVDLDTVRHVKLAGFARDDCIGIPVMAGDVDGDGTGDFLKALDTSWNGVKWSGLVVLIYGSKTLPPDIDLASMEAAGVRFARFTTLEENSGLGYSQSRAGDLNGDGYGDLCFSGLVGTNAGGIAGGLYIVYGGPVLHGDIDVEHVGAEVPGCVLEGVGPSKRSIAPVGDVNGDGRDDLAVGFHWVQNYRGAVYLLLGGPALAAQSRLRAAEPGGPLVEVLGPAGSSEFGFAVSSVGDVDSDGYTDFIVGELNGNSAHLIYGMRDWPSRIAVGDSSLRVLELRGKTLMDSPVGPRPNAPLGGGVSGIGDWNADGLPDFFIDAQQQEVRHGSSTGEGYVIFGSNQLPAAASADDVGSAKLPGITIVGDGPWNEFGELVYSGGDINLDGRQDFLATGGRFGEKEVPPDLETEVLGPMYTYAFLGGARIGLDLEVTGVLPAEGGADGGDVVSICGGGFRGDETVLFGSTPAASVTALSSAELRVTTPPTDSTGPVDVLVSRGGALSRLEGGFRYLEAPDYRDITLDPDALRAAGYRVMVFHDSQWPAPGFLVRQFISVFAADLNGDGRDELIVGQPLEGEERSGRVSIIFGSTSLPAEIGPGETQRYGTLIKPEADRWNMSAYIATPGDVDGDGFPDLVLGGASDVAQANPASWSGATYVVRGRARWPAVLQLADEIQTGGAIVLPHEACGQSHVAPCGDLDGDGHADFLVGTYPPIGSPIPGEGCLGADAEVRIYLDAAHVDTDPPLRIEGDPELIQLADETFPPFRWARAFGSTVSGAGDLNGDGFLDLIIGAEHQLGAFYFLLGEQGGWSFREASITEFADAGRTVFLPYEHQVGYFGLYAASLGDFNGDGIDDALLGSPGSGPDFDGAAFVVLGSPAFGRDVKELSVLREGRGKVVKVTGESHYDWNGYVAALGDVNGDGLADFGITGDDQRNKQGRAYVIFGSRDPPERIELSDYLGSYGFRIRSLPGNVLSGSNGAMAAGDFDGDGFRDIAIGEAAAGERRVVVIFGRGSGAAAFVRGDANRDGKVDLSDAVSVLSYLFLGGREPGCKDAGDVNDSGALELTDAIYLLNHLYLGTAAPSPPYPLPGRDETPDLLGCSGF